MAELRTAAAEWRKIEANAPSEQSPFSVEQTAELLRLYAIEEGATRDFAEECGTLGVHSPDAYAEQCEYISRIVQSYQRGQPPIPIFLATTNTDRLLERELVRAGVSFLSVRANPDGSYTQAHFFVDTADDTQAVTIHNTPPRDWHEHPILHELQNDGKLTSIPYSPDVIADSSLRISMSRERFRRYEASFGSDYPETDTWEASEIDRIIRSRYENDSIHVAKQLGTGASKEFGSTRADAICKYFMESGLPILIKFRGCSLVPECPTGHSPSAMLRSYENLAGKAFPPGRLLDPLSKSAWLFCGISLGNFWDIYSYMRLIMGQKEMVVLKPTERRGDHDNDEFGILDDILDSDRIRPHLLPKKAKIIKRHAVRSYLVEYEKLIDEEFR
jgi:hypothetical protein